MKITVLLIVLAVLLGVLHTFVMVADGARTHTVHRTQQTAHRIVRSMGGGYGYPMRKANQRRNDMTVYTGIFIPRVVSASKVADLEAVTEAVQDDDSSKQGKVGRRSILPHRDGGDNEEEMDEPTILRRMASHILEKYKEADSK